ncbi:centromere protein J [Mugil cephalus]|uniref:centromere protein J n=1 Tax=Mugil cephalus TaxID=48193 RepID=UPI001FB7CA2F|nr:centromere protein J [Mugil cephalus]
MSSPAGLEYSQADFLARWMPSSTRAGVILNPSADLASSLRHMPAMGSPHLVPDDSFASDFAPLPASADSSCLEVDGFAGGSLGGERPVNSLCPVTANVSDGRLDSLEEMASKSQDMPLMMKLEQLRKWQQHMQEQLKAHQLEELLRLQEEQQKLLGAVNGSQLCTGEMSGAEWPEDTLHESSHYRERTYSSDIHPRGVPQGSTCGLRQEQQLRVNQDHDESDHDEEESWDSREDDQEQSVDISQFPEQLIQGSGATRAEDDSRREDVNDRPIRPGIGGQKQTFEELLEEQLRLEEQKLKSAQQQQSQHGASQIPAKRAFLKRGEGLSRFTKNRKASVQKPEVKNDPKQKPQARGISRSNSEPASIQRVSTNSAPRLPVQRKTAILNKENRQRGQISPPQDVRAESKAARTKVLGCHQRHNTKGPEYIQGEREGKQSKHPLEQSNRRVGLCVQAVRNPNPVTKHLGALAAQNEAAKEKSSCGSKAEPAGGRRASSGGDGAQRDSFELSFQEKLQRWECDQQVENMELGEFELLEQAAEELSFSSNSSFVMKVLHMDQKHWKRHAATGLHQRRLSSTPIKSPPRGSLQSCSSALTCESSSGNSEAPLAKSKLSAEDKEEVDSGREDKCEMSDISSCDDSDFTEQDGLVKSTLSFPVASNPPYDKRTYEDEDDFRDSASDVAQEDDDDDDDEESVLSNADESTLVEDEGSRRVRVVFDDDDTWNDLDDTTCDKRETSPVSKLTAGGKTPADKTLVRKVAASKAAELDEDTADLVPDPPPASQLMTRLFPSLKPKAQNKPLPPPPAPHAPTESRKPDEETVQQVQSRQLRERLVELEIEIERFKKENAALTKLRQDNETKQENLRRERLEFEQTKAEELAQFEEYKKEENRKLQKERKLFEKHASAARAIPDKKEREEIQVLKQQLSSLQEELRRRESRWTSTQSRLRQQIDSLNQENSSLRDEVRMLEKLRLSAWKKNPGEKDAETKDAPRIFEKNVSSMTKGVTFASPLDSRGGSSSSISPPQSSTAAATRRNSRESGQVTAAGTKSSLRRTSRQEPPSSSSSSSSSSSLPDRRTEEKSQEKPPSPEQPHSCSPKRDSPAKETEPSETEESTQEVITHPDGKVEKVLVGGDRLIVFPNGTRKEVSADGRSVKVTFFNGDTKQITADQRVIYYYSEAQTTHITYPDGMEVLHFPNNQTEKHFPDGRKEITFADQTVKNLFPDGREESVLTDGTIIQVNPDGTKQIHFNTGQKEIHTSDYKRREYPDGTVKTVYADGRQETRYPTGRLRIKDKDGNVIVDNRA